MAKAKPANKATPAKKAAKPKPARQQQTRSARAAKATPARVAAKTKPARGAKAKPARAARTKPARVAARPAPRAPSPSNARLAPKKPPAGEPAAKKSGGQIVQILDDDRPLEALRRYLGSFDGGATEQQGQIALGSAQLMLFAIEREHRGGDDVKQVVDLVLSRWAAFPEPTGFHAQGFLRNAFAAIGDDTERLRALVRLVPADASPELRYNIAAAYAYAGDKPALLPALADALDAGASPDQIRRDTDFGAFVRDPDVEELLARAGAPEIPVDVAPHLRPVRAALDATLATLRKFGAEPPLPAPATLERILGVERIARIQLPNDYRALLTLSDGPRLLEFSFLGTSDFTSDTELARTTRTNLGSGWRDGRGIGACVPLARWGQPTDWLLYDPLGDVRGAPGYVLVFDDGQLSLRDLVHAFERLEQATEYELGTN
ncbi:MAG TPA: hypothetical protein VM513_18675 [Kofleriaceae bacterium]|jgi:hypothetical protein|nr:hypothetical protein [Kofleriaceae bacterium]